MAVLPPVSVSVYRLEGCIPRQSDLEESDGRSAPSSPITKVYCMRCPEGVKTLGARVEMTNIPEGGIVLENRIYKLYFHSETKLLQSVKNKVRLIITPLRPIKSGEGEDNGLFITPVLKVL